MNRQGAITVLIAADLGNSETKMYINDQFLKQPSVIKRLFSKPENLELDVEKSILNLDHELLVNVSSQAIRRDGLFMIGERASRSADVENMNIKLGNKYKHDLPVIMLLGMVASHEVRNQYMEQGALPNFLEVKAKLSTAIPASEHTNEKAEALRRRILDHSHHVTLHVGEQQVNVQVSFDDVNVTQEGIPALYTLRAANHGILKDYVSLYDYNISEEKLDKLPKKIAEKNIVHVDIGDGTTEFNYTEKLNPVLDLSDGQRFGVGHATQEAINLLKSEVGGYLDLNRQQFMDIHRDRNNPLHKDAVNKLMEAKYTQSRLLLEAVQEKVVQTAGRVNFIMVYGGGSIQFKTELYEDLIEFAADAKLEVIWVPEEYAINMNVDGLRILNEKVLYA
ncbi:ParM/StbA family protein [Geomicrobium sp. JCM 19055]|uniref:ParM/StbA family protein n=1 Tax=Geomicrobium sp. JCM 19055 TaxID=1460649 RepID=UPI002235CD4A|nr:ParM/StbA family protein [Geomicrobium sp. JCM 19055]